MQRSQNYTMDFNLDELKQLLEKKFPEILIAYIFGSSKDSFVKIGTTGRRIV